MNAADLATVRAYFGSRFPITEVKYDANNNAEYIGIAPSGTPSSSKGWLIEKLTYDANNNYLRSRFSSYDSIMDDYLTTTYS